LANIASKTTKVTAIFRQRIPVVRIHQGRTVRLPAGLDLAKLRFDDGVDPGRLAVQVAQLSEELHPRLGFESAGAPLLGARRPTAELPVLIR